jgi:1-acyl-sn-glycerol-3-phosphate acyltransferase
MQRIVIDQPYEFVPPRWSRGWAGLIRLWLPGFLRRKFGLVETATVGGEHLRGALAAGQGVLVASNHTRNSDPMVLGLGLEREIGGGPMHIMAGWHLFKQSRVQRFLLPRVGAFSVYREGGDRESLQCATRILVRGEIPLVVFPEGYVSHSNERLAPLMHGVAFMARVAAKRRVDQGNPAGVVVVPSFVRYFFDGDLESAVNPVLEAIERRLWWQVQDHRSLCERIERIGEALLASREIEHLGAVGSGDPVARVARLIGHLLGSLECEWEVAAGQRDTMERVKRLRAAILAAMIDGSEMPEAERARRWHQLGILYQVQQLNCHPGKFPAADARAEEILDVVDQFEEDLTDANRPHPPRRAVVYHGVAIPVSGERRGGDIDARFMGVLRERLEDLMRESRGWRGS